MPAQFSYRYLSWFGCLLATACLVCSSGITQAALLAYEPFEYGDVAVPSEGQYALGNEESGVNVLGGQNPTIGPTPFYTGPWIQSASDAQVVKALPSLSYPNFPAGVGGIQQETRQFDCCTVGRTGREIAGGLGGGHESRTLYESFLIDFGTQGTDDPTMFGKRGHELWNGAIGDANLAIDLFVNSFSGTNELTLAVTTASGTQSTLVNGGGLTLDAMAGTNLVVIKYEFNPADAVDPLVTSADDDIVTVYFNPVLNNEPMTPSAQIRVNASDLLITHQGALSNFTFSGDGHVPGAIDEIRWGETYRAAVPQVIPEPSSLALLALAMLGFCGRRH